MGLNALFITEGTGGHFLPALETAKLLADKGIGVDFWYAGRSSTETWMQQILQEYASENLRVKRLNFPAGNVFRQLGQAMGLWVSSLKYFRTVQPNAVVGFGGRVSLPVLGAALRHRAGGNRMGLVVHEQNAELGRANRLLSRWVDHVALSFPLTTQLSKQVTFSYTGMPIRSQFKPLVKAHNLDAYTLLILGGSQGSRSVNRLVLDAAKQLNDEQKKRWRFIHVTGSLDYALVQKSYQENGIQAEVHQHVSSMETLYAKSDIVVSRAGASTLAEVACSGLPAIFIPYPFAGAHQEANARIFEKAGAAFMLKERQSSPRRLLKILTLLDQDVQHRLYMGSRAKESHMPHAVERLAQVILDHRYPRPVPGTAQSWTEQDAEQPKENLVYELD